MPGTKLGLTRVPSSASTLMVKSLMTNKSYRPHNSACTTLLILLCRSNKVRWFSVLHCPDQTKVYVELRSFASLCSICLALAPSISFIWVLRFDLIKIKTRKILPIPLSIVAWEMFSLSGKKETWILSGNELRESVAFLAEAILTTAVFDTSREQRERGWAVDG